MLAAVETVADVLTEAVLVGMGGAVIVRSEGLEEVTGSMVDSEGEAEADAEAASFSSAIFAFNCARTCCFMASAASGTFIGRSDESDESNGMMIRTGAGGIFLSHPYLDKSTVGETSVLCSWFRS